MIWYLGNIQFDVGVQGRAEAILHVVNRMVMLISITPLLL